MNIYETRRHSADEWSYGQERFTAEYAPVDDSLFAGKSRVIAFFLLLFAGTIGAHDFYLGRSRQGVTKAVLTLAGIIIPGGFVYQIAMLIVWLWVFFDAGRILLRLGEFR